MTAAWLCAGAAAFAPSSSLPFAPQQLVKSAALLVTELSTVGFDRRRSQSWDSRLLERSLSDRAITSPLRAATRTADRVASHICMVQSSVACSDDLRTFLTQRAGVSPAYVDKVLELCDEQMIGSVHNLQTASELGMLAGLFKPVVAMGIQSALADVGGASKPPSVAGAAAQLQHVLKDDAAPAQPQLAGAAAYATPLAVAQRGLEVEPYWDMMPHLPMNTFKPKRPHVASIASVRRIVGAAAPGEVCHVVIETGGAVKYWEGQSLGVRPPGDDPSTGKPNSVRLYSIASSRYGDDGAATSISLCVRRAVYWDSALGAEDPAKKGVCSNFMCAMEHGLGLGSAPASCARPNPHPHLSPNPHPHLHHHPPPHHSTFPLPLTRCDARPGDDITVTGPMGKVMLIPEHTPAADLIMVGTGTGVAPYRGFLRRLFAEDTPAKAHFKGLAWLFLGVHPPPPTALTPTPILTQPQP